MAKISIKEEASDLKTKLRLVEADLHTLYGMLAAKGIIDDRQFQKDSKAMSKYIEKEERISD